MDERVKRSSVTFRHPFTLRGEERLQPAGSYEIETVEEPILGLSFVAYRRVSTTIILTGPAHTRQLSRSTRRTWPPLSRMTQRTAVTRDELR